MTDAKVVKADELATGRREVLYYIAADNGKIMRNDIRGEGGQVITGLVSTDSLSDRLFACEDNGRWDLFLGIGRQTDSRDFKKKELVLKNFALLAPKEGGMGYGESNEPQGTMMNFGLVPTLSTSGTDLKWECRTGFWSDYGIRCKNKMKNREFHLALETPFITWGVRNAVQLDGDLVVFQLGNDQICLLNMREKKIALIARGYGPLVALPK